MIFQKAYILVILFLVGCASNPLSETLDDWSNQKDDDYWYGTAIISKKNFNGENFLRIIPREEILDIEEYLKWLEIWREAIYDHVTFMKSMEGWADLPIELWELAVSSRFRFRI